MFFKLSVFCLIILLLGLNTQSQAVNINFGPNGCTLQDAIRSANNDSSVGNCSSGSGHDILISPDVWIISLNSQLPTITSDMTIRTATPSGFLDITGNDNRIMKVTGSTTDLTLNRVFFHAAHPLNMSNGGSAIRIVDANVNITDSFFSDNTDFTGKGGAINVVNGSLVIENSDFSYNTSTAINGPFISKVGKGGAIYAGNSSVDITTTSFFTNRAESISNFISEYWKGSSIYMDTGTLSFDSSLIQEEYSGIFALNAVVDIQNSTFAKSAVDQFAYMLIVWGFSTVTINHATFAASLEISGNVNVFATNSIFGNYCNLNDDVNLIIASQNFDIADPWGCVDIPSPEINVELLSLANNGGATKTHALRYTSDAINIGDPNYCLLSDQRGVAREPLCDVGAYEATGVLDFSVSSDIDQSQPYVHGQTINYTATITNNGGSIANAVEVDVNPTHAVVTAIDSSLCSSFPCVINAIKSMQSVSIPVSLTLSNFDTDFDIALSATKTANSQFTDPDLSNNTDDVTFSLSTGADLSLNMVLNSQTSHFIGEVIEYQVDITNHGFNTADLPLLTFNPKGLNVVSFVGCISVTGNLCQVNNINNSATKTITINAQITAAEFDATASVDSTTTDIDLSNNIDISGNNGALNKTNVVIDSLFIDTSGPQYSLDFIRFQLKLSTGNEPATNVKVFHSFDQGSFAMNCSHLIGAGGWCEVPSIPANSIEIVTIDYLNPYARPGIQTSFNFHVLVAPGETDTDLSNNQANIMVNILESTDISTSIDLITQEPFTEGQLVEYNLRVYNVGVNSGTSIDIGYQASNLSFLWAAGDACPTIQCTINELSFQNEENVTMVFQIIDAGTFSLYVEALANQFDPVLLNNTDLINETAIEAPIFETIFFDSFE